MLIPRKHVGLEQKGYHHHLIEMKHALTMIWLKNWPSLTHIRITIYLVNMIRPFVCSFLILDYSLVSSNRFMDVSSADKYSN
jgi:hypothetical protein